MQTIGLQQLKKKYNKGDSFLRTILCRPEFNQFRELTDNFFVFKNDINFHKMLKFIIEAKENRYKRLSILFIFLFFGCQSVWCQQYEPVIIYNSTGEPEILLKGSIRYDAYGVPKFNTQTKGSMPCIRAKQGY